MAWPEREQARRLLTAEQNAVPLGIGDRLRICLCYPNTYYVGMSNLGFQTLYFLLNSLPGVRCERAFLPEKQGREPLLSLETQTPLGNFDVLAFSISFDLDVLNVPRMLFLSGIPLFSAERRRPPVVIAGGIVPTFNPEPLAEMVDAFVIGEAEEVTPRLAQALANLLPKDNPMGELIPLTGMPGVYVPSLYRVEHERNGEIAAIEPLGGAPEKVTRLFVSCLDSWPCHSRVLTPKTEFGGLFLVEVSRGCARGCKFCVAAHCYRPARHRSAAAVLHSAQGGLEFRDTVGLIGAAVSDHPEIERICRQILRAGGQVSLASVRADSLTPSLLEALAASGTRTLTLAPEAGSERLRGLLRKGLSDEQILEAAREAARVGLKRLRLYFMVGLPGESEEDIHAIAVLAKRVRQQGISSLTLSACAFVPKPHTSFQREAMAPPAVVRERLGMLLRLLGKERGVETTFESPTQSFLQALISRGDRRLAGVLARLAETASARLGDWRKALASEGLCGEGFACRNRAEEEILPWEHIGA